MHTYRHKRTPKNSEEREFKMLGKVGLRGGEDSEGKVGDMCGSYLGPMCKPFWPDWGPVQGSWWEARLGMAS